MKRINRELLLGLTAVLLILGLAAIVCWVHNPTPPHVLCSSPQQKDCIQ